MKNNIWRCLAFAAVIGLGLVPGGRAQAQQESGQELLTLEAPAQKQSIQDLDGLSDPETLFEQYFQKQAYGTEQVNDTAVYRKRANALVRDSALSGTEKKLYDALKAKIGQVADGKLSSTSFEIPAEDILGSGVTEKYKADALGVDSIVKNGAIAGEAVEALYEKLGFADIRYDRILDCLMADCPYELYWFDKEDGILQGHTPPRAAGYNDQYEIFLEDPVIIFQMSVIQDFAVSSSYQAGNRDRADALCSVSADTGKTGAARTAVAAAKNVVKANASKKDYQKLDAYREWICKEASYNTAAASSATAYGNPWQLIWVFDGNSSTKVVCEGYAKAFKYLCDLSDFSGSQVECRTVSGTMSGGTGAGDHMWNLVTMDDGCNYLADITNCDAGTIGADRKLFLVGTSIGSPSTAYTVRVDTGSGSHDIIYSYDPGTKSLYTLKKLTLSAADYVYCDHVWDGGRVTKAPTCTEKGVRTYSCKKDASHTKTEEIPAAGHSWDAGKVKTPVSPGKDGEKVYTCTVCKKTRMESIKATAADVEKWIGALPSDPGTGDEAAVAAVRKSYEALSASEKGKVSAAVLSSLKSAETAVKTKKDAGDKNGQQTKAADSDEGTKTGTEEATDTARQKAGVKKGQTFTIKKLKYKVTKVSAKGKGTVTLTGPAGKKAKLKKLTIPATVKIKGVKYKVTAIGKNAFKGCKKLKTVTIKSKTIKSVGKNAIKGIYKKAVIKVPKAKLKAYKKLFKKRTGFTKKMKIRK